MNSFKVKIIAFDSVCNWYARHLGYEVDVTNSDFVDEMGNTYYVNAHDCTEYIPRRYCMRVKQEYLQEKLQAAKDNVLIIEKAIAEDAELNAAEARLAKEASDKVAKEEYEATVALHRKQPGRRKFVIGMRNFTIRLYNTELAVDFFYNNNHGPFGVFFKERADAVNAINVVGEEALIKAIKYEQSIGL